ncbi:hypothetical protein EIR71_20610, partial [Salmonella enterica]|nr:hypothetical protein [Salmonella enterica]
MATDSWVTIGGFLASSCSAIAAIYAVKQSVLQRTISIKPELIIKDIELKTIYIDKSIFPCKTFDLNAEYDIDIPVLNIGLGTALNIKYQWLFEYNKHIASCGFVKLEDHPIYSKQSVAKFTKGVFYEDNDENQYHNYDFFNNGFMKPYSIPKVNKEIEYIMPITQNPEVVSIKLPSLIPMLLITEADQTNSLTDIMLEPIKFGKLKITYEDISGTKKNIQLDITMRMISFQSTGEHGPESVFKINFHRSEKKS